MNKKQILSVAAGVVMLTACSEYDPGLTKGGVGDYTPADLQLMEKYTENFEARYGTIDENHTWGFGSAAQGAKTRAANSEANQWADSDHGNWKVPDPLTAEQIAVVTKYFQTHKNPQYEDPKWTNYFVQQVYTGGSAPREGYSPEKYLAADEQNYTSGTQLDHLSAVDGEFVDHIYNFNHGDCGINNDVLDNGKTVNNGTYHSDKIMLMENSTTKFFGYANSNASVVRTEYTGLVSYKTIMAAMGDEAKCLDDGWDRSFMGFDFENIIEDEMCVPGDENWKWHWSYSYVSSENEQGGSSKVEWPQGWADGKEYPTFNVGSKSCRILISSRNIYACDTNEPNYHGKVTVNLYNNEDQTAFIEKLMDLGYMPVQDSNEWIKPGTVADGYYSDWIVSLAEAKKNGTPNPNPSDTPSGETWYRIMCEDLGNTNDFDFNDLVFDVYFTGEPGNYTAHVRVQAAGGTLPIYLAIDGNESYEAHHLLGMWDETIVPINVGTSNTAAPKDIVIDNLVTNNPNDINIYVEKKVAENTKETILLPKSGTNRSLSKAPQKICIPNGQNVRWMKEMQQIEWGYPHFADWVQNEWGQYGFNGATPWTTTEVNPSPLY